MTVDSMEKDSPLGQKKDTKGFGRPFGKSSLTCILMAVALAAMSNLLTRNASDPNFNAVPGIVLLRQAFGIVTISLIITAVILGTLAQFGLGKLQGHAYRLRGFLGLSGGVLLLCIIGFAFIQKPLQKQFKYAEKTEIAKMLGPDSFQLPECGVKLCKPADDWVIMTDDRVKQFGDGAVAILAKMEVDPKQSRMGVLFTESHSEDVLKDFVPEDAAEQLIADLHLESPQISWLDSHHPGANSIRFLAYGTPQEAVSPVTYDVTIIFFEKQIIKFVAFGAEASSSPDADVDLAAISRSLLY